jgi:predicted NAD/FAD-dependent oxidoreductase
MKAGVVQEWHGSVVAIEHGRVRPVEWHKRYVGVPAMNAIAKDLSSSLQVTTDTRVTSMTFQGDQWHLRDEADRELGCFDSVVVALPSTQAAELLADLPAIAQQARGCTLAPCWAVMVGFEERLDLAFDGAFVQASNLRWIARNSAKPCRPQPECWVLHASPEWSREHIEDAPEAVCDALLAEWGEIVGIRSPRPVHLAAHRWRYALPTEPLSIGCLWDDAKRIAVCGDWCRGARIEGAFLSGLAAGERVLGAIGVPLDGRITGP